MAQEVAALRAPRQRTGHVDRPDGKRVVMTVKDAPAEAVAAAAAVEKLVKSLGTLQ